MQLVIKSTSFSTRKNIAEFPTMVAANNGEVVSVGVKEAGGGKSWKPVITLLFRSGRFKEHSSLMTLFSWLCYLQFTAKLSHHDCLSWVVLLTEALVLQAADSVRLDALSSVRGVCAKALFLCVLNASPCSTDSTALITSQQRTGGNSLSSLFCGPFIVWSVIISVWSGKCRGQLQIIRLPDTIPRQE